MRRNKNYFMNKITKYLPVFIILLSLSIIIGSTFAYFTDKIDKESELTFSKVELSGETTTGINGSLRDVIPGTPLVDGALKFSKSIDSEALYVRVKISFSLPSEFASDTDMIMLIDALRSSTDFNINTEPANNAVWAKYGVYYYLVEETDNTTLKRVDTIDTYVLSEEIVVPRDLKNLDGNAQYMKSINFHIAFEAIQADNVSANLSETKEVFDNIFPISDSERSLTKVTFKGVDLLNNFQVVTLEDEDVLTKPVFNMPVDGEGTSTLTFEGWYTDREFTNKFDFDSEINSDLTLYPLTYEVSENLSFEPTADGLGYAFGKGTCEDTFVVVPAMYKGLPVTETINNAFKSDLTIERVLLPNGIKKISYMSFYGAKNLSKINLPSSLENMGEYPLGGTALTEIVFDKDIALQHIPRSAFSGTKIEEIVIPKNVTYLHVQSFQNCKNLKRVIFEEGSQCANIGPKVFEGCENLENIILPSNISIDLNNPFCGAVNLKIEFKEVSTKYSLDGNCLVRVSDGVLISGFNNSVIPDNITQICEYAFYNCTNLVSQRIPSSVKSIGYGSFEKCSSMTSITFEENSKCTSIDRGVFRDCSSLSSINLPNIPVLNDELFKGCGNLESIDIPSSVTLINNLVFGNCVKLNNVVISDKITSIGTSAFKNCTALTNITFESDDTVIGKSVFYDCVLLNNVTLPKNITKIDSSLFYNCTSLTSITIPSGVVSLEDNAFYKCENLESINFENVNNITSIGKNVFLSCKKLTNIDLPNGITTLGSGLFHGCESLDFDALPDSITTIQDSVFYGCASLTLSQLPDGVTSIGSYCFYGCTSLTSIKIPNGVTKIQASVFADCINLVSIELSSEVSSIESYAFKNCSKIPSIRLSSKITEINSASFYNFGGYILCETSEVATMVGVGNYTKKIYYLDTETDFDGIEFTAVEDGGDVNGTYTDTTTGNIYVRCGEVGSYTYYIKYVK